MKLTEQRLKEIIREEVNNICEGFLEDPFDTPAGKPSSGGLIAQMLGLQWGEMPRSDVFIKNVLPQIKIDAMTTKREPRQVAEEEIAIMRRQFGELMDKIEGRILSYYPRGTQTQSQALTADGDVVTYSNP